MNYFGMKYPNYGQNLTKTRFMNSGSGRRHAERDYSGKSLTNSYVSSGAVTPEIFLARVRGSWMLYYKRSVEVTYKSSNNGTKWLLAYSVMEIKNKLALSIDYKKLVS